MPQRVRAADERQCTRIEERNAMKIPAYWTKGTAEDTDQNGQKASFSCWRSSERSPEDARASAMAAAKRILRIIIGGERPGRYAYGEVPLREEALEKFANEQGELVAAVTRNAYGSLVLNTDGVMFVDLDFPPASFGETIQFFFKRLFNKSATSPESQRESEITRRLERFLADKPQWGLRLYRTRAGLRALATHDLFDPAAESTLAMLRSVGCDPLYVQLCKTQKSFRARLTPKPWRCGVTTNPVRWPFENDDQQRRFERWQSDYALRQSKYATCRFLGTLGNGRLHPEVARIVDVHDKSTRCQEPLQLA
jgi:hypothetical protein